MYLLDWSDSAWRGWSRTTELYQLLAIIRLKNAVQLEMQPFPRRARPFWAWFPLPILLLIAIGCRRFLPSWGFMWALAFAIYFGVKWLTWWKARDIVPHTRGRSLAYLLAWPGMDAVAFLNKGHRPSKPKARQWLWASGKTCFGIVLLWVCVRIVPPDFPLARGWVGLFGLIFLLHFGSFHLAGLGWQALGVSAQPIMQSPASSHSLSEFWGRRWNLGFRQLSHDLLFQPLRRPLGVAATTFLVFLFSGLIHELVISVPAHGGYGLPTGYFLLQGFGVLFERSRIGRYLGLQSGVRGWTLMAFLTAAPIRFLFRTPFITRVILPFLQAIHAL